MDLRTRRGTVLVEPIERAKGQTSKIKGFEFANPEFQGVPNTGIVAVVASDEAELKVGDKVVFAEPKPRAFRYKGRRLFCLDRKCVKAIVEVENA